MKLILGHLCLLVGSMLTVVSIGLATSPVSMAGPLDFSFIGAAWQLVVLLMIAATPFSIGFYMLRKHRGFQFTYSLLTAIAILCFTLSQLSIASPFSEIQSELYCPAPKSSFYLSFFASLICVTLAMSRLYKRTQPCAPANLTKSA